MNYVDHIDLTSATRSSSRGDILPGRGPGLNAFEITNLDDLTWEIALYEVDAVEGENRGRDRSKIRSLFWDLKADAKTPGFGFIVDVSRRHVAVPQEWEYPEGRHGDYRVTRKDEFTARAAHPGHEHIAKPILREGIKNHFKNAPPVETHLGPLWQSYSWFCEVPKSRDQHEGPLFCRMYRLWPERLRDGRWALKPAILTKVVDGRTIADYYRQGEVEQLANIIRRRRKGRLTRDNRPLDVNMLREGDATRSWQMYALAEPEVIAGHADLPAGKQKEQAAADVRCKQFKRPPRSQPPELLRLILSSHDTEKDHRETILDPEERTREYQDIRSAFATLDVFDAPVELSPSLVSVDKFPLMEIAPPKVQVLGAESTTVSVDAPAEFTASALKKRANDRARHVQQHGYIESTSLDPLLACPASRFDQDRAERLKNDLNYILKQQNLPFRFEECLLYEDAGDIESAIQDTGTDSLLAVLPEGRRAPQTTHDTHDTIKKRVGVPSQCIQYDNTLHPKWVDRPYQEFMRREGHQARRLKTRYQLTINSFLIKCHWVPFAPAQPFHYDVHVGIDVGGPHNNKVVASVGFGFSRPEDSLLFYVDDIHTTTQKVEPIPVDALQRGLHSLLSQLRAYLKDLDGVAPDFNRILFFRDGEFRGQGDAWHELDALRGLYDEFTVRGWVDEKDAIWTATEVTKRAGYWRVLGQSDGLVENPLVGTVVFPFDSEDEALVCTTGAPYLPQGTASPLRIRVRDVVGDSDVPSVLQDVVWEADMCFTKIDMGMSLPWTLNVADTGALQSAKAYRINGVTV